MSAVEGAAGSASLIVQVGYHAMSQGMAYERWKGDSIIRMIEMAKVQPGLNSGGGAEIISKALALI